MTKYRAVIFDWEGTLGDTAGQVVHAIQSEAIRLGFGPVNELLVREAIDSGNMHLLSQACEGLTKACYPALRGAVQQALSTRSNTVYLMPGAAAIVSLLNKHNILCAIATNKNPQSLQRALSQCEIGSYFKVTRAAGQTLPKPHPQMLQEILVVLDCAPEEALMVGDSTNDIFMANAVEVDAIGVTLYHQDKIPLFEAGARLVIDNYASLAEYLHLPYDKDLFL